MIKSTPKKSTARFAGLLYLVMVLTGIFSLMYMPSKLVHWNDATITFKNIKDNETLFRLGIFVGICCYTSFLFLAIVLYKLLNPVNPSQAKLMVLLAVINIPMYFINVQNQFTILSLINNVSYLKVFSISQLQSQVLIYLTQYNNGMNMIHIFSGLWLFPFGYLVYRSNFLPKVFGVLLMLGCFGYLSNFIGETLVANYSKL